MNRLDVTRNLDPSNTLLPFRRAVDRSDLNGLLNLYSKININGDSNLFDIAITIGNIEIIQCLLDHHCPHYRDAYCLTRALDRGHIQVFKLLLERHFELSDELVIYGLQDYGVAFLEMIKEANMTFNESIFHLVALNYNEECIRYLINKECPFGFNTLCLIVTQSNLDLVKSLLENGKYSHDRKEYETIYSYVKELTILRYLYEEAKLEEWNDDTFTLLVQTGNVDMLKYLLEKGCSMNEETFNVALDGNSVEVVKFLHENSCPIEFPIELYKDSLFIDDFHKDIGQYFHDHIWDTNKCSVCCTNCLRVKVEYLWKTWILEGNVYHQWLPREMMEDVLSLF